jgi:hypothetical protein
MPALLRPSVHVDGIILTPWAQRFVLSGYAFAHEHGPNRNTTNPDVTLDIVPGGR